MINISVLNSNLECIAVLDYYTSFIWTDRYNDTGEFELYIPVTAKYAQNIKKDYFLSIKSSNRLMIVESIKIETDHEEGNKYKITGRSLESILDRRIVWKQTDVNGSVQDAIHRLIDEAFMGEETWEGSTYKFDPRRRISNFVFVASTDTEVTGKTYTEAAQYMGDDILSIVKKVCQAYRIGFKITLNQGNFEFTLYAGKDRSYDQHDNSYVVFSPSHDNLLSSNYLESIKNYKNVLRIAGEGEGATQTFITHYLEYDDNNASEMTGFSRREIYVDCHDVSSVTSNDVTMDIQQYANTLVQKGVEKLVDLVPETAFEGEINSTTMFVYQQDFEVGDIVEICNEYGIDDQVRVTEVIQTWEADGYSCIPTLESRENEKGAESKNTKPTTTIFETVVTASTDLDMGLSSAALVVEWVDPYDSAETTRTDRLVHTEATVHFPTQLMNIWFDSEQNKWKVKILKSGTSVLDKLTGTTTVYQRGMIIDWLYTDTVDYEVSYTT